MQVRLWHDSQVVPGTRILVALNAYLCEYRHSHARKRRGELLQGLTSGSCPCSRLGMKTNLGLSGAESPSKG